MGKTNTMAEDLITGLQTYKIQLEQVEAALTSDPSNAELLKLKDDLTEVINLTKNLIETQTIAIAGAREQETVDEEDIPIKQWRPGMDCSAPWSEDGQWYNAVIDSITDDGFVAVTFDGFNNTDVTKASLLKEKKLVEKRSAQAAGFSKEAEKNKKKELENQRVHQKKRKQKKHDRQKQIEEAHEADKAKWQAFAHKKKLKGVTKKSIFATPEAANGRVGIGTCGVGGQPMTEFSAAEKWRKGT